MKASADAQTHIIGMYWFAYITVRVCVCLCVGVRFAALIKLPLFSLSLSP